MSVQFGKCNFDGKPVDPKDLDQVRQVLAPFGPDGEGYICKDNIGIVYRAFHTTKESRLENQPHVSASGTTITWDGRLDNREDLIGELRGEVSANSTDLSIVAAAYQSWGTNAFAKLVGDWAASFWSPRSQSLVLAKDFVGTRPLYYSLENAQATWSTTLDPLVLFAGKSLPLCKEYIAGWFSSFPAVHLTPYVGISSVPPSSFVLLQLGKCATTRYWDFDPGCRIRYRTDGEYEEHFRAVFAEAVRRRLRSDTPVLAELSGGMDSSSIVCVADAVLARGGGETPRLDTVSYYNDSEPNWDERPYFTKVEEKRGRAGCHIHVGWQEGFNIDSERGRFAATPATTCAQLSESGKQFIEAITAQGNRIVLSGIGGDETTGGVPTPSPELGDLIVRFRLGKLAHQLKVWALNKRKPWFYLAWDATRSFFPPALVHVSKYQKHPSWLNPGFANEHCAALRGYEKRFTLFGPSPSFQENLATLDSLRRQLACSPLPSAPTYETRYPYLDRSLLEFTYAIPREQLVRPGQRRSLMRRGLARIVPGEILTRRRKAYVTRSPVTALASSGWIYTELRKRMVSSELKIVDKEEFLKVLQEASRGHAVPIVPLFRALSIEFWLRQVESLGILAAPDEREQFRSEALCAAQKLS